MTVLSSQSVVVAAKDQISADLGGETVILNLKTGVYYGLSAVGFHVWNIIQKPACIEDIRDSIVSEYEVEADKCENDLMQLLTEMHDQGLVEIR
ncbi:MAG: lasso peptide biosynthesis PqqD family chaperone [Acidobacteria bacterium]|nr:lasso peptide biosynthesis PqqD family chaperone [Acidobacteriota bacterium]